MLKSVISTAHNYYSFLLSLPKKGNQNFTKSLVSSFDHAIRIEGLWETYHLQDLIVGKPIGSEEYLKPNKVKSGDESLYCYDFYLSMIDLAGVEYIFICYPYKSLEDHLYKKLPALFKDKPFRVPVIKTVLEYTKSNNSFQSIEGKYEMLVDVIKYSAEVLGQTNADKVNLVGTNPQDSEIYRKLNNWFKILPSSVKLRFSKDKDMKRKEYVDLIFDRIGNYRFWISKDTMSQSLEILSVAYKYLNSINALKEQGHLSKYEIFDDGE